MIKPAASHQLLNWTVQPRVLLLALLLTGAVIPSQLAFAQAGSEVGDGFGDPDSLDDFSDVFPDEAPSFDDPGDQSDSSLTLPEEEAPPPPPPAPAFEDPDEEPVPQNFGEPGLVPAPRGGSVSEVPAQDYASPPAPRLREEPVVGTTDFEERFNRIYQNYLQKPVPLERWNELLGERRSELYPIQKGDTLWDISRTFFNDGAYWPKMWAINSDITNPHMVQPGYEIQFFAGTLHESPSLKIAEEGASLPPAALAAGVSIPPSSVKPPKSKEGIPPSFPQYTYLPPPQEEQEVQMITVKKSFPPPTIPVTSFVSDKNYYSLGTVVGVENGSDSAVSFDMIFIRSNGQAEPGRVLTVLKETGEESAPTENGHPSDVRKIKRYEAQGVVRIKEVVNSVENIYRAEVLRSFGPVTAGSFLVQDEPEMVNLSPSGAEFPVKGHIVGGHSLSRAKMFGPSSFIFIDAGSEQGVRKGQLVPIYSNPLVRFRDVRVLQNQRRIGFAKVATVSPQFSTAVTLELSEEARVGDLTSQSAALVIEGPRVLKWVDATAPQPTEAIPPPTMAAGEGFPGTDVELEALTKDFDFEESSPGGAEPITDEDFEDFDF